MLTPTHDDGMNRLAYLIGTAVAAVVVGTANRLLGLRGGSR